MGRKKKKEEEKKNCMKIGDKNFVEVFRTSCCYETIEIPDGVSRVEAKLDYDGCYYESDSPTIMLIFYKEENE
jgi:hypothetical protein